MKITMFSSMPRFPSLKYLVWTLPFIVLSCKGPHSSEPVTQPPQVTTSGAISLSSTKLLLAGKIAPNDFATKYYFEYGFTSSYGSQTPMREIEAGSAELIVQDTISVIPDSTYHFRLVALYSGSTILGADKAFDGKYLPLVSIPSFPIDRVTYYSVSGMVKPRGFQTQCYFEYGLTTEYGQKTPVIEIDPIHDSIYVSADFKDLGSGTYHWRLFASNQAGAAVTADSSFDFVTGSATADQPTNITTTGVTFNGQVNTGQRVAQYRFAYGATPYYGFYSSYTPLTEINSGAESVAISSQVNDLLPGNQYHWRLEVTFPTALLASADSVFTTSTTPVSPQEFFFPEMPGTQLTYQYAYAHTSGPYGSSENITGIHTWSIQSATSIDTMTTIVVEDIRIDTVRIHSLYSGDTTYVSHDSVQFSVVRTADTFTFNFPTRFLASKFKSMPRFLEGTDTLTYKTTIEDTPKKGYCTYVSTIGLLGFSMYQSSNQYFSEAMSFISMLP